MNGQFTLTEWKVDCKHVYGFNMDEWSDESGVTLDPVLQVLSECNGKPYTILLAHLPYQRSRETLPLKTIFHISRKIAELKQKGQTSYSFGIGGVFHIAFWEPHFAEDFGSVEE